MKHYKITAFIGPCEQSEAEDAACDVMETLSQMGAAVLVHEEDLAELEKNAA